MGDYSIPSFGDDMGGARGENAAVYRFPFVCCCGSTVKDERDLISHRLPPLVVLAGRRPASVGYGAAANVLVEHDPMLDSFEVQKCCEERHPPGDCPEPRYEVSTENEARHDG